MCGQVHLPQKQSHIYRKWHQHATSKGMHWQLLIGSSVIQKKSDLSNKMQFFSKQWLCQYYYMDAQHGCWLSVRRKSLIATAQECYELYWTNPGGNTPTKWHLYSHLPPILKTIKSRHAEHCRRSKDKLISVVLLGIKTTVWAFH